MLLKLLNKTPLYKVLSLLFHRMSKTFICDALTPDASFNLFHYLENSVKVSSR
jgi:hypothetical protein